jgi:signal transduction histidine kinase
MQQAAAKNKEIKDSELEVLTPSGRKMTMLGSAKPLVNSDGTVRGSLATFIDITERKKAEEMLLQAQIKLQEYADNLEHLVEEKTKQAKDSERLAAIGATAGMVGHDIRNPLQAIAGDVYFARKDVAKLSNSPEKQRIQESLLEIDKSVTYINKIVQDLQDFARPIKPSIQETDVEALCRELLQGVNKPSNISAICQVEETLRNLPIDALILRRILTNLVNNAIQAMPDGGKVTLKGYRDGKDAVITIQDTGNGIPDDVKPKLFTPLMTTKSKGQGFGLAVVKRMTEALDGTVTFESEVGKGTKFVIRLPIKE